MSEQQYYNMLWRTALQEARHYRVIDQLGIRHAYATALMWWYHGATWAERPDIVSGYRSPERQRVLRQRWDRGDRTGIVARPACRSWHTIGRAIDVQNNRPQWLDVYGYYMRALGARWGKDFNNPDPNHFDLPTPTQQPPNICLQTA
jgi:hypothetical protein